MVGKPPVYRLNFEIPEVAGVIAVTIHAGFVQDCLNISGYCKRTSDIVWLRAFGNVSSRVNELYDYKNDE
jgi:hypothetical protein